MTRVRLVKPSARWLPDFVAAVRGSRRLHGRWVSPPATSNAYRAYLQRLRRPTHEGYLVCLRGSRGLVGTVNMAEGLRLVLDDAFGRLGLHRLEANIQPDNVPSIRLVRRLGFRREGYSPRYLKIRGRWRDHERWAILEDEGGRGPRRRPQRGPERG
jgi:ribosomal-protein-alanine N-acetyltransferase